MSWVGWVLAICTIVSVASFLTQLGLVIWQTTSVWRLKRLAKKMGL